MTASRSIGVPARLAGPELPLRERFHGIAIQLRIEPLHNLNAVHRAILANDRVQNHLAAHVVGDQRLRIFRIHCLQRLRDRKAGRACGTADLLFLELREIQNPASARARQVRQSSRAACKPLYRKEFFPAAWWDRSCGRATTPHARCRSSPGAARATTPGAWRTLDSLPFPIVLLNPFPEPFPGPFPGPPVSPRFRPRPAPFPVPLPVDAVPPLLPTGAFGGLIMIATGSELEPAPPAAPLFSAAFAVAEAPLDVAEVAPPAAPDFPPSGDTEMRAARFPCGTLRFGEGGAGDAESAMMRCKLVSPWPGDGTSGAGASVAAGFRVVARADIASIDICGASFTATGDAMLIGPAFFSVFATSGAATS